MAALIQVPGDFVENRSRASTTAGPCSRLAMRLVVDWVRGRGSRTTVGFSWKVWVNSSTSPGRVTVARATLMPASLISSGEAAAQMAPRVAWKWG